ncbi:MAG: hypothetical protein AAGB12_13795 [Pseudomonadota bacterium]
MDHFKLARDASGFYKKLSPGQTPPTFHEIRSLLIFLFEQQGVDAQARAAHNERQTTEKYKKGHQIEWNVVELAEIQLDKNSN